MPLRMGLIGLGSINAVHVMGYQACSDDAQIVAVCDTREDVVMAKARQLDCRGYTDYRALLDDSEVDAVDITLPHNLHYEVARAALERGKHVLIEKPMATTMAECQMLVDLAERQGVVFTVAENTRFVDAYIAAHEHIRRGDIGDIRLIRTLIYGTEVARLSNPSLWKGRKDGSVGGVIMDSGPHSFYLLKWLNGDLLTVQASMAKVVTVSEVEDYAIVRGRFMNDALYACEFTFTAEIPWGERLEVYGSRGTIIVDQMDNPPARLYRGGMDFTGTPLEGIDYDPMRWKLTSIIAGVQDFVGAIKDERSPAVNPRDGVYAIQVVERAYESVANAGREMNVG
jgi:predicted dehydrogenase